MKVVKGLVALALFFGVLYIGIQFARDNNQVVSLKLPGGFETLGVELWAMVIIVAGAATMLIAQLYPRTVETAVLNESRSQRLIDHFVAGPEGAQFRLEDPRGLRRRRRKRLQDLQPSRHLFGAG